MKPLKEALKEFQAMYISNALNKCDGNVRDTQKILGIECSQTFYTLRKKSAELANQLKQLEIERIRKEAECKIKSIDSNLSLYIDFYGINESHKKWYEMVNYICNKLDIEQQWNKRNIEYIIPKYALIYYCVRHKRFSLKQAGLIFGGRDHSTIHYAVKNFDNWLQVNDSGSRELLNKIIDAGLEFENEKNNTSN